LSAWTLGHIRLAYNSYQRRRAEAGMMAATGWVYQAVGMKVNGQQSDGVSSLD